MSTLALFGVAHFIPQNGFPTTEYYLESGIADWAKYFNNEKREEELTERERLEAGLGIG